MGRSGSVGPSPVRCQHDPEPVVVEVSEAVGEPADLLDDEMASVPPLDTPPVSK